MNRALPPVLFLSLVLAPTLLGAQTMIAPVDPYGRIFSATLRPEVQKTGLAKFASDSSAPYTLLGIEIQDSSSSESGSFSLGYGTSVAGRDLFVLGSYSHVHSDTSGGADRASAYGELSLLTNSFLTMSAVASALYDPDSFKAYSVALAADHYFISDTLKATANLGWGGLKPKTEKSVSDVQPAIGLSLSPDNKHLWNISVDYTFKNNVDGEDSASAAISRTIENSGLSLKLTGQKHNSYSLSLAKIF